MKIFGYRPIFAAVFALLLICSTVFATAASPPGDHSPVNVSKMAVVPDITQDVSYNVTSTDPPVTTEVVTSTAHTALSLNRMRPAIVLRA